MISVGRGRRGSCKDDEGMIPIDVRWPSRNGVRRTELALSGR